MYEDDIDIYVPSLLNPRSVKKLSNDLTLTQNSIRSRCSLSLKKNSIISKTKKNLNKVFSQDKENISNNVTCDKLKKTKENGVKKLEDEETLHLSAIEDLPFFNDHLSLSTEIGVPLVCNNAKTDDNNNSFISLSSATELSYVENKSDDTLVYNIDLKPSYTVCFSVNNTNNVELSTKNTNIKHVSVTNDNNNMSFECEIIEISDESVEMETEQEVLPYKHSPSKRPSVAVNLEIKKQKLSQQTEREENKVLILNTNDVKKLSDVIVQPSNNKLLKNKIKDQSKFIAATRISASQTRFRNGKAVHDKLKQKSIDCYFSNVLKVKKIVDVNGSVDLIKNGDGLKDKILAQDDSHDMSKNLCITAIKHDATVPSTKASRKNNESVKSARKLSHRSISPRIDIKESEATQFSKVKNESIGSYSPRKIVESIQFHLPVKSKSNKTSTVTRIIPNYKIVAGTHFAVDAFAYGDIPNVKHYFLTHFHSDHYSGLKKNFNKLLFCSKITADLCVSRLGVNMKHIHIMNVDESIKIDGVEVMAVDANHCPGAVMLVFTLPSGKTLLHTGDFRASPIMESYPIFWNRDIHTIYLDTTYCNPRYDFPTQDQSLEMALYHLRQKKTMLEKAGKKFSSVLIVCGTYTIGKEKFFLGMARRVGCSVWACPEKDRVLRAVEGRSFSHAPPHSCQLHVVPMRDLTHEKLKSYLDSLQGAFSEVVAFKPSGWENGKNSCVEKDSVTIYGIPYSEHSSFSEMIRFVKFLKPKQVVPTVDISGGIKSVQKYFPCPLVFKEDIQSQSKVTDYFSLQRAHQVTAVT
ncbi:unnamed protein product [Colias eurytheme]|nr:unnamed protein product [Colias eurytheme]